MSREEIEYLANEICVLKRDLRDLENKVNRCMWGPAKPEGVTYYDHILELTEIKRHFKQYQDQHIEKCLREHIEYELKEVDKCKERDRCLDTYNMVRYWDGMKTGYTNIRCWLDGRK